MTGSSVMPINLFQLLIEGTVGDGHEGDIAIDDFSFSSDCVFLETPLPPGTMPPTVPSPCLDAEFLCQDGVTCISSTKVSLSFAINYHL